MENLEIDASLPIAAKADEIGRLLHTHQVVIVAGETGSGKTTQLPKICVAAGAERIAHTQPRRIAARSVAQRIADECGVELGEFVGYQVRFTRQTSRQTRIKVMTDGILLNELSFDPLLRHYDTIIIDEAHERSLNIDFLLGYLKQLVAKRPELKVIVTSATIDTQRFSEHFDDAPVVEVSGRTYPVEIRYRPPDPDSDDVTAIVQALEEVVTEPGSGDVLVFLAGERDIRDAQEAIAGMGLTDWDVLPLFARLSASDQQRVFQPHGRRRIVLATNVAETSITVPGIRYVIDTGLARISRYSARTKVQRLPIEPISQASANQRSGRCGRIGPGIAIRLYSEEDFATRDEFTPPEILRTNLATVILQMAQAGLGEIESFPFVEAPNQANIADGLRVLEELGAIRDRAKGRRIQLTGIGRRLARLPVDPRLGRMLLEASRRGCLREVIVIVAGLTVPDIRERPLEFQAAADELHRRFHSPLRDGADGPAQTPSGEPLRHTVHTGTRPEKAGTKALEGGDFEVLLNIWEYLRQQRKALTGSKFRAKMRAEYLHYVRYREWQDLVQQLRQACRDLGMHPESGAMPDVLRSLLAGLLSHIGLKQVASTRSAKRRELVEYTAPRGAKFAIQPGSCLAKATPELVMAFELVETSRLWARTVAKISPEWVEDVGGHMLTRTLSEPHFAKRSATVVAHERVSLLGVPIVADRITGYARRHPVEAREIFIRQALVEGQWETRNPVVRDHRFAMAEAERLTERMRRPDLLISDEQLYAFYDARLPATVCSGATFDKYTRKHRDALVLTPAMLMSDPGLVKISDFPDTWQVGEFSLPVTYVFDPGAGHDGVTVEIPLEVLGQLPVAPLTWQVPGLRRDLAVELVRSLPKSLRTFCVPAPDYAEQALRYVTQHPQPEETFPEALARALHRITGQPITASDFRIDSIDSHLKPTFVVTDGAARVGQGTDLEQLQLELAPQVAGKLTQAAGSLSATGKTAWDFGDVPVEVDLGQGVVGYPHLTDEGATVGVAVSSDAQQAAYLHARGVRRLLVLTNPSPITWVVAHLSNRTKLALGASSYPTVPDLLADAWLKASGSLVPDAQPVRTRDDFARLANQVRQHCPDATKNVVETTARVLETQAEVERLLTGLSPDDPLAADVKEQLANLTFPLFVSATPDPWFERLPVYLAAIKHRLQTAPRDRAKDDRLMADVHQVEDEYALVVEREPAGPLRPEVEEIAFLLEELRVSFFAQHLGTAQPVSVKRVRQAMRRL